MRGNLLLTVRFNENQQSKMGVTLVKLLTHTHTHTHIYIYILFEKPFQKKIKMLCILFFLHKKVNI